METALVVEKEARSAATRGGQNHGTYVPFLDGLRAVSILLIMGFHQLGPLSAWVSTQINGWVSVDLFFIISGFLITSIMLKEREKHGSINLKNFYVRRWLRISPAYFCFLALMFFWMLYRGQHDGPAFAIAGLYLTNIDMCAGWGLCTPASGLMHTWTLSVEEQFYLLWPGTLKFSGKKALAICITLIVACYFWRLYLLSTGAGWIRMSSGLDGRMDSIMLGVAAGLLWNNPNFQLRARQVCAIPALQIVLLTTLLIACHFLGHPGTETQPLLFWGLKFPFVLFLITTFMVSLLASPSSIPAKILSCKPLVWVGRLSYSLYLYHVIVNFPCVHAVFQTVFHHKKYLIEFAKFATCFGLAASSFYFIEQPFLKLKDKFS